MLCLQPQVLHSSNFQNQEPLTTLCPTPPPPHSEAPSTTQPLHLSQPEAPAPLNPCSTWPGHLITSTLCSPDACSMDSWISVRKERRRTSTRSVQLCPPSKLSLSKTATSGSASATTASQRQARPAKQLPHNAESSGASDVKFKMAAFTNGSSRLPKPKCHGSVGPATRLCSP